MIYPFKLSIHGYARISKTYEAGKALKSTKSFIAEGDEIHGEAVDGYSCKPLGKPTVEHATATHKASFVKARGGAYAHVEIGVRDQLASAKKSLGTDVRDK